MKFTGFDHFDDELGGDDKIIEAQSWGGPFKDMKRSYAPENLSPGSLIPCVAAPKLEKIKITAKLGLGNRKNIMWESCRPFLNMFCKGRNSLTLVALN